MCLLNDSPAFDSVSPSFETQLVHQIPDPCLLAVCVLVAVERQSVLVWVPGNKQSCLLPLHSLLL